MKARWAMLSCLSLAGCSGESGNDTPKLQRANPASENCVAKSGKHTTESTPAGELGICLFADNRQCEEWALLRGHCPAGGIHVAGFTTDQQRHCAIRGGRMHGTACALPDGEGL